MKHKTFFAINRHNKTTTLLPHFSFWEQVQTAFRMGIQMPDGDLATGIGRVKSVADFQSRATVSKMRIL